MTYQLNIMAPGHFDGAPFATFHSDTPFMRLGVGELIDPGSFTDKAPNQLFKILHLVHTFRTGEDGVLVQMVTLYTSKIYDCASIRSELVKRS